jgi:hypothetical protein
MLALSLSKGCDKLSPYGVMPENGEELRFRSASMVAKVVTNAVRQTEPPNR